MNHIEQFSFSVDGLEFVARIYSDDTQERPDEKSDGHGKIREVRAPYGLKYENIKKPGERVIWSDGGYFWLYDWQDACKQARADGWNAAPYDAPNRIERAVNADFDFLRGWFAREWEYVGVSVSLASEPDSFDYAVWGIESNSRDYLQEVARELAQERIGAMPESQAETVECTG